MMQNKKSIQDVITKTVVVHTVTYFLVGLTSYFVFDYSTQFVDPALVSLMRPTNDPLVQAGILFQPLRGIIFGFVFYRLQSVFFEKEKGYLNIWLTLIIVGIFSTFGTAPGSIEGLIYTKMNITGMWQGLSEVLLQSFLLSYLAWYWINHPEKKWLGRVLTTIFVVSLLIPILGLVASLAAS